MLERILIPLDGSARAEAVLSQLASVLRRKDSEILLARAVLHDAGESLRVSGVDLAGLSRELRTEAQDYLKALSLRMAGEGIRARSCLIEGPAAEAILDAARCEQATMIALTTHGRTGIARWMTGSVAEKIARASELPVFLVPSFRPAARGEKAPASPEPLPFKRILVPLDGSPESMSIVAPAAEFGRLFGSEMVVLHVGPSPLKGAEDPVTEPALQRFHHAGLRAVRVTREGDPSSEIIDFSAANDIDLVAMASHGRSGMSRWMLGSVAERVLRASAVPILLSRASCTPLP
jgi:nucleotide-binding universal stress UspA family protein